MSVIGKLLHILSLVVYRSPRSIRLRRAGFPLPCPVFLVNLVLNLNSPRSSLGIEFNDTKSLFINCKEIHFWCLQLDNYCWSGFTCAVCALPSLASLSLPPPQGKIHGGQGGGSGTHGKYTAPPRGKYTKIHGRQGAVHTVNTQRHHQAEGKYTIKKCRVRKQTTPCIHG